MIIEGAQMLCTALRVWGAKLGVDGEPLYHATHANHPCNVWARETSGNWYWLYWHTRALNMERCRRTLKEDHATYVKMVGWRLPLVFQAYAPEDVQLRGPTPFVNCAANSALGLDFKSEVDVHVAYRKYLGARWKRDLKPPKCTVNYLHS